jgi:hypothetical protein
LEPAEQNQASGAAVSQSILSRCGSAFPANHRPPPPPPPKESTVDPKLNNWLSLALQRSTHRKGPERRQKSQRGARPRQQRSYFSLPVRFPSAVHRILAFSMHFLPWTCTADPKLMTFVMGSYMRQRWPAARLMAWACLRSSRMPPRGGVFIIRLPHSAAVRIPLAVSRCAALLSLGRTLATTKISETYSQAADYRTGSPSMSGLSGELAVPLACPLIHGPEAAMDLPLHRWFNSLCIFAPHVSLPSPRPVEATAASSRGRAPIRGSVWAASIPNAAVRVLGELGIQYVMDNASLPSLEARVSVSPPCWQEDRRI